MPLRTFRTSAAVASTVFTLLTVASGARAEDNEPFRGVHAYLGLTAGGGGGVGMGTIGSSYGGGALGLAGASVRGGVEIGRFQLDVDVTPFSSAYLLSRATGTFQALAGPGVLIPIAGRWSWPLRVQAGVAAIVDAGPPLFAARVDLVGVEFRAPLERGHLSFELDLGSRVLVSGTSDVFLSWEGRVGVAYVFQ